MANFQDGVGPDKRPKPGFQKSLLLHLIRSILSMRVAAGLWISYNHGSGSSPRRRPTAPAVIPNKMSK